MDSAALPDGHATVSEQQFARVCEDLGSQQMKTPATPKGKGLVYAAKIHSILETWMVAGQDFRFSFNVLDQCAELEGNCRTVFRSFLGDEAWLRWYPAPTEADPDGTVPRQLATTLYLTLSMVRQAFDKEQAMKAEAAQAYGLLVSQDRSKKARVHLGSQGDTTGPVAAAAV